MSDPVRLDMEPELQLHSCLWLLHELRTAGQRLRRLQPAAVPAQTRWLENARDLRDLTLAWHDELVRSMEPSSQHHEANAAEQNDRDGGSNDAIASAKDRGQPIEATSQRSLIDRTMRRVRRELRERNAQPEQLAELRETLRHLEAVAGRQDRADAASARSDDRAPGSLPERGRRSLAEQARAAIAQLDEQATAMDRTRLRIHAIEETSVHRAAPAWNQARAALAAEDGIMLEPRFGLVPLGRNRSTGLYEFWHVASGDRPPFDPTTGGSVNAESGLVMVLLPGGSSNIGSRRGATNEEPVHQVTLDPYWIAKHEMTQAQWERCFGTIPSTYTEGAKPYGQRAPVSPQHPVESIDWEQAQRLTGVGLELPTEAQWEHAARAGTSTEYWTGVTAASLHGKANLRDRQTLGDGYAVHAPVGSLAPNAFGLHDVCGNVAEWCADPFGSYHLPAQPKDGARALPSSNWRPVRGGSYADGPFAARSAARQRHRASYRHATIGVRPALRVR